MVQWVVDDFAKGFEASVYKVSTCRTSSKRRQTAFKFLISSHSSFDTSVLNVSCTMVHKWSRDTSKGDSL